MREQGGFILFFFSLVGRCGVPNNLFLGVEGCSGNGGRWMEGGAKAKMQQV